MRQSEVGKVGRIPFWTGQPTVAANFLKLKSSSKPQHIFLAPCRGPKALPGT